jgi:hypothetical protein
MPTLRLPLTALSTDFTGHRAVECLWDCEAPTRKIAIRNSAIGGDIVQSRLRAVLDDPAEDSECKQAASDRIAASSGN